MPWPAPFVDVTVALTAVALATERLRFGALMTPLPRRRPAKFAREMVSLDRLSSGRLIVGAVLGVDDELAQLGEEPDARRRAAMLDEALAVINALWQGEPVTFHGAHYRLEAVTFLPTPVQQPRIPVWTGGAWPRRQPFRRAARWDGVVPMPLGGGPQDFLTPDDIRQIHALVSSQRPAGAPPFDLAAGAETPGDDPVRAAAIVRPYQAAGATWWLEPLHEIRADFRAQAMDVPDWPLEAMRRRVRQGPPRP